jgi:ATP-dependent Lon protease
MSEQPFNALQGAGEIPSPVTSAAPTSGPDAMPAIPGTLAILPVRGFVVFPRTMSPINVQRAASIQLLNETLPHNKIIGLVAQRDQSKDEPTAEDLYQVGTAVMVLKLLRQAEDRVVIIVQALRRFRIRKITQTAPFLCAEIELLNMLPAPATKEFEAAFRNLRDSSAKLLELTPDVPEQARAIVLGIEDAEELTDFLSPNLNIEVAQKQALLEENDIEKRLHAVQTSISSQLEIAQIQQKLQQDVQSQFSDAQRRAYLREQVKAIRKELGEGESGAEEQMAQLRQKLEAAQPPQEVMKQAERELKRLDFVPQASPDYSVIVTYVETIAELPWSKLSADNLDLDQAQQILDRDHYDLEKVKRRLIEYLAVRKLNPQGHGAILCFLGPPGVGKTSLGQSIADALGRKFVRMSLGGIRDEAEIRGHRRTYIGSMPGRIIQELRRAGTRNPVMLLDEIDKIGADFRGDAASALFAVLDLSQIIFIATANYIDGVPEPMRDRMEIISLAGYTGREKLEIARRYLVRRQLEENGLKPEQCEWQEEAIVRVIDDYTHEAGVRELERQIGAVCRSVAAQVARGKTDNVTITPDLIAGTLGQGRYIQDTKL